MIQIPQRSISPGCVPSSDIETTEAAPAAPVADQPSVGSALGTADPLRRFNDLFSFPSHTQPLYSSTGGAGSNAPSQKAVQAQIDALGQAALDGDLAKVQALIKAGVDVNAKDSHLGWTPLMHALTAGNNQIAELLLNRGARVDEPLPDGHTALTLLAKRDGLDPANMELLLKKGADKNHQDVSGKTALKWATENGNNAMVSELLAAGVSPNVQDGFGRTALMEAVRRNDAQLVDVLAPMTKVHKLSLPFVDVELEEVDQDGDTALMQAAKHQDASADVIKSLLKNGALANKGDALNRSALWQVATKGDSEAVKALLAAGAKPDEPDPMRGTTPLFEAASKGDSVSIEALLGKKAKPNFKDSVDRTVLMEAAKSGNTTAVKLLVDKGAMANNKDKAGVTALQEAVALPQTDPQMIEALLKAQADPNVPLDKATGRTPLMELAAKGDQQSIELLKQNKVRANLDAQDKEGRTALMEAAEKGNRQAVGALVGTGGYSGFKPPWADTTKKDKNGDTALSLVQKALKQPTITPFDRDEGKPGITAYDRERLETIREMLEKAPAKNP
jgi:ankyrin repeat protein